MVSKKVVLKFPKEIASKPLTSDLARKFNLTFNIMSAQIFPRKEGKLILEISGEEPDFEKGIKYLKDNGVDLQFIEETILRDEERCYHCGFCLPVCPTDALTIDDRSTMRVELHKDRCIACGYCVRVCPVGAIKLSEIA